MVNLVRKNQKIFAGNATNNGQFGSLQDGLGIPSSDLDVLQANAAFEEGWNDATISGDELPAVEEFQGLNYINTSQIAYIMQKGIPEWEIATDYYIGDITREVGGAKLYKSLTDNNEGNALTDVVNWKLYYDPENSTFDNLTINQKLTTPPIIQTISSGSISYTGSYIRLNGEGNVDDTLNVITGGSVGDRLLLKNNGVNGTITVLDNDTSGGNIVLVRNQDTTLEFSIDSLELVYEGPNWIQVNLESDADLNSALQTVNFETGAVATGSTIIPNNDTIPQSNEGDQYMSLSITPKFANSKLKIEVSAQISGGNSLVNGVLALFKDSDTDALACSGQFENNAGVLNNCQLSHYMIAGTTSTIDFKVRAGNGISGGITFNGTGGNRRYGGALSSSITITEIRA